MIVRRLTQRLIRATLLAALAMLCVVHRLAFWLDERLFPGLQTIRVERPIFIVGMPRSGTTLAHRLLISAAPRRMTTMPLWELVLAPALVEKYCLRGVLRIDRWLGGWLRWGIERAQNRIARGLDDIHVSRLQTPEEDFLGLLPQAGCFLAVLVWPERGSVWQLVRFTEQVPAERQRRLLDAYHGLIVRHLKFRGVDKRYVAKNASFVSWLPALRERYPDGTFLALTRDLSEAVPSQLSSIAGGLRLFGNDPRDPRLVDRFVELMAWNLATLEASGELAGRDQEEAEGRLFVWEYEDFLQNRLLLTRALLTSAGLAQSNTRVPQLEAACTASRRYRSNHRYCLVEWGLSESQLSVALARHRKRTAGVLNCEHRSGRDGAGDEGSWQRLTMKGVRNADDWRGSG